MPALKPTDERAVHNAATRILAHVRQQRAEAERRALLDAWWVDCEVAARAKRPPPPCPVPSEEP